MATSEEQEAIAKFDAELARERRVFEEKQNRRRLEFVAAAESAAEAKRHAARDEKLGLQTQQQTTPMSSKPQPEQPSGCPGSSSDNAGKGDACSSCSSKAECGKNKNALSEMNQDIKSRMQMVHHTVIVMSGT